MRNSYEAEASYSKGSMKWDGLEIFKLIVSVQRYSDDGEPSGTAGMPILEVLRGQDLRNVLVSVTRYFGGTLLGTGGLVRAYSHSALQALEAAWVIEKSLYQAFHVMADYSYLGKIQYTAAQNHWTIQDTAYTDQVEMKIYVPEEEEPSFYREMGDLTAGQGKIRSEERVYGAYIQEKFIVFQDNEDRMRQ